MTAKHCETCTCGDGGVALAEEPRPAFSLTIDGAAIVQALRDYERQTGRHLLR